MEGNVGEFKKGFAHFAIGNGVPVVPVSLSGTKELWLRKRVLVVVGAPISPDGRTVDELVSDGRQRVAELLPARQPSRGPRMLRKQLTSLL